ncbi:MAG: hypothetical protein V3U87_15885 [Methylococcaceae bacterium]
MILSTKYPILVDDEYINDDNDPFSVKEVTELNSVSIEEDKIMANVKKGRSDIAMKNHDYIMEEKVLDSLKRGKIK